LLQLTQRFDELTNAVQYMSLGKLPISFVNPTTLQNILRNVSLQMPENFELIAGTRIQNIYLYYKLISVTVMGDANGIKLFINVPLKTVESYFSLYKIIALPMRLIDDKLIRYQIDFPYFGLNHNQHDNVLLNEADLRRCTVSMTVCPANMAVYSTQIVSCESSLFFQTADSYRVCRKSLLVSHSMPTLLNHESTWMYNFREPQLVTLRCWTNNTWTTYTKTLVGTGMMVDTTGCSVTTNTLRTIPELLGKTRSSLSTPLLYTPDKIQVEADVEMQALEEIKSSEVMRLDDVMVRMKSRPRTLDVVTLLHIRQSSVQQKQQTQWYFIVIIVFCSVTLLAVLCFSLRARTYNFLLRCFIKPTVSPPDTFVREDCTPPTPNPRQELRDVRDHFERNVTFAMYPTHQTA